MIRGIDCIKQGIAADVIEVGMGIHHNDRQAGELLHHLADIPHAESGIHQQGLFTAGDEIGDDLLEMPGLTDGIQIRLNPVDLKPVLCHRDPFQRRVRRTGQGIVPVFRLHGAVRLLYGCFLHECHFLSANLCIIIQSFPGIVNPYSPAFPAGNPQNPLGISPCFPAVCPKSA